MNLRKLIQEVLSDVIGEDYPTTFDMSYFKSLKSFRQRLEYAGMHLQRISSGSGRVVFKIDDTKVLKVAKNIKGIEQNTTEAEYFIQNHYGDIVTKLYDSHIDDYWIEMEKARKVSHGEFKRITGIDFNLFAGYIRHVGTHNTSPENYEVYKGINENPFIYEVIDLMGNYDMPHGDFMRLNSYGIVNRGGKDRVVLVDFGLTKDTYETHYQKTPSSRYAMA